MKKKNKVVLVSSLVLIGLVILFIVLDVLFLGASWWPFHKERGQYSTSVANLRSLSRIINEFQQSHGEFPEDLNEIKKSLGNLSSGDSRNSLFIDGWKQKFKYEYKTPKLNPGKFDLYSIGENGKDEYAEPGFGDDIHVHSNGEVKKTKL